LEKLVKYVKKCQGGYICREMPGGEKEHIHGLIIYDEIRHKDSIMKQFRRMMECIPAEDYEFKKALLLKCVYSDDWKGNYLQKADDTIVDYDKIGDVEYCNQIVKREENDKVPLAQKILSVCQHKEVKSYKSIRCEVFKYLVENGIPPPRMDMITSICKTLYCYQNVDNEELIDKLPVPEGFEKDSSDALKSLPYKPLLY
jgi:hypothetical protein